MLKKVEAKQQQEKLKFEKLFNNLHAHLGPQVDVVKPPMVEVSSTPIPNDALTTISTSSMPREITPLNVVAPIGLSEERI